MDYRSFDPELQSYTASYIYIYNDTTFKGTANGNCFLGSSVCAATWYEDGPEEGISLLVAKNEKVHYETWFYVPALSLFDPKHIDDPTEHYHNDHGDMIMEMDISDPETAKKKFDYPSPTHPLTYPLTRLLAHLPTHLLAHLPTHSPTHSPIHSPIHSPTHSSTHSLTHSPTH